MSDELFESSETFDETESQADDAPAGPSEEELAEKAFNDGLNKAQGIEPEPESQEATPEPVIRFAGMTEDELKAVLDKAAQFDQLNDRLKQTHDKAFGKIGQLEQMLKQIADKPASTGKPMTVSKETFKRLAEVFDDEGVAEALAEDFAGLQFEQPDLSEFSKTVADKVRESLREELKGELTQEFEVKLLTARHPDWQELYHSEDFAHWKGTLKPEAQQTIDSSWDGSTLAKAFDQFKTWQNKRAESIEKRTKRLEDAVPISGSGGSGQRKTDEDAFNRGLKRVLANR